MKEWYQITARMQDFITRIGAATQHGSAIDRMVSERASSHFITQQYIDEIMVNLTLDGFPSTYESIREVILDERAPRDVPETVALRYHQILHSFDAMEDVTFTPQLIEGYYAQLIADCGDAVEPSVQPSYPVECFCTLFDEPPSRQWRLEVMCALANRRMTDPVLPDIVLSLLVNCFFWRYSPFDHFNNIMGCIASRLFLCQAGFPVFRFIPKSMLYVRWRSGELVSPDGHLFSEAAVHDGNFIDYTVMYESILGLMLQSVQQMEASLNVRKKIDDDALRGIQSSPFFNYRQAHLLGQAVLAPDTEFNIRSHQVLHNVAYSTARADLLKLVEMGLLSQSVRDSVFFYRATPGFKTQLAQLAVEKYESPIDNR
ncbi:MAG: hypothetical protein IJ131_00930 [Eggerthellaceae bacterium]|nr:hypothetical protein [Eggerthellaceae bacterium]